ncbi:DUF1801 domain-containing protein [Shewanella sp. KT0246]|uniref:DUF1801 domain-containing protein n=1 Tax=Shewanella sp. KT0246 TaxID=2815912 RepID=UPI001BC6F222|nr:DUF1801 domain-containing protein [Shewanella sp. KT0246]GIU53595.1 hypothetical protein TUM4249_32360 [Shewanella sp. KT0246]
MTEVEQFLSNIDKETRKSDAHNLLTILEEVSGYKPYLTGSIIGFGQYHYRYESGREGDSPVIGFSPRKQNLVVYIMPGFNEFESLLKNLGKYKLGKSCLYINKLSDLNLDVFKDIARLSVQYMQQKYQC